MMKVFVYSKMLDSYCLHHEGFNLSSHPIATFKRRKTADGIQDCFDVDLADLARACGYRLEPLEPPKAVDDGAWSRSVNDIIKSLYVPTEVKLSPSRAWNTGEVNMGMPEEDFPTGQWPFPTQQNNADLEEHIARSPENEAAEYRIAVKKAIFRGPL